MHILTLIYFFAIFQVIAGQFYITTYETTKQTLLSNQSLMLQHLCGGFLASTVSQTIMVPVDIISQYQQMSGVEKTGMKTSTVTMSTNATRQEFSQIGSLICWSRSDILNQWFSNVGGRSGGVLWGTLGVHIYMNIPIFSKKFYYCGWLIILYTRSENNSAY